MYLARAHNSYSCILKYLNRLDIPGCYLCPLRWYQALT